MFYETKVADAYGAWLAARDARQAYFDKCESSNVNWNDVGVPSQEEVDRLRQVYFELDAARESLPDLREVTD